MAQDENVQHSEAKSVVAKQKPRDAQGKFLSGEALAQYNAQQQRAQMDSERARLDQLFGRQGGQSSGQPPLVSQPMTQQNTIQSNMPIPQQNSNFQAILDANRPGKFANPEQNTDKWDTLLGKKRLNMRW